jgi:hypothetical protein
MSVKKKEVGRNRLKNFFPLSRPTLCSFTSDKIFAFAFSSPLIRSLLFSLADIIKIIIFINYRAIIVTRMFYDSIHFSFYSSSSSSITTARCFVGRFGRLRDATGFDLSGFGDVGGNSSSSSSLSVKRSL